MKIMSTVKNYDDDSLTKMLSLVLSDELLMVGYNELRKEKGLKPIDF